LGLFEIRLNISPAIEIATFNILLAMPQGSFLGAFVVGWLRYRGITSRKTHQNIIAPYYFDTDLLLFSTPFFLVGGFKHLLISILDMGCHPSHWRTYICQRGRSTTNQNGMEWGSLFSDRSILYESHFRTKLPQTRHTWSLLECPKRRTLCARPYTSMCHGIS
jgi:hypothetical protein